MKYKYGKTRKLDDKMEGRVDTKTGKKKEDLECAIRWLEET